MSGQLQLPEDQPHPLVQPGEGGVLGRDVLPGGGGVGQPGGHDHLVGSVEDGLPVRDLSHLASRPVVLAELSVLGLGVAAPVRVVEGDVEEERRGEVGEKLSGQQLDVGYISPCQHQTTLPCPASVLLTHGVDGIVLLSLGEVEGKDLLRSHVFLTNDPSVDVVLHQDLADGPHLVEAVVVVDLVVQAVLEYYKYNITTRILPLKYYK